MKKLLFIVLLLLGNLAISQDICDNGIDDDNDGLIDLQDTTDCSCDMIVTSDSTAVPSLIPNPSFENRSCCPSSLGQLNCADTWQQASAATSDYFNTCGTTHIGIFNPPPNPLPDGNGYVGFYNGSSTGSNYKEYVGTCLSDTMFAGTSYQIQFNMAIGGGDLNAQIAIYGTTDCNNLPFGGNNSQYGCPSNGPQFTQLDLQTVTLSNTSWTTVTLSFVPTQNITAIVLGGDCALSTNRNYYYVDNLLLNTTASFNAPVAGITSSGFYCLSNMVLKASFDTVPNSFQWYKDSIAVIGATDSLYNVPAAGGTGNYQVRLMYDSGCVLTPPFLVDSVAINFSLDSIGSCSAGAISGQIEVLNTGGGDGPYEFQLNSNPFVTDSVFDLLTPGNYTITVRDANMCTSSTIPITVDSYTSPQSSFTADTVCLGTATTFSNTSTGPITNVFWVFGDGNTSTQNLATIQHQYSNAGIYMVKLVTSTAQGCTDSMSIQVLVQDMPIANFTFADDCEEETIQFTNTTTIGGGTNTTGLIWNWNLGNSNTSSVKNPSTTYNVNGTYNVTLSVSSPGGCVADTTKQIEIFPNPVADFNSTIVCFGEITQINDASTVSSGTISSWNYTIENLNYTVQNPMYQFSASGNFNVKQVVQTQDGCVDSITKTLVVYSLPIANFDFNPSDLSIFQTRTCFNNLSQGAVSYFWDYGFGGTTSVLEEQCIEFPREVNGFYDVFLSVTNQYGCLDTIIKTIEVQDEFLIFVPNTFTPDNDGVNDIFLPKMSGIDKIDFYIFNKWGDQIFYTDKPNEGWDGKFKNNQLCKEDTYVYRIIVLDIFGNKHLKEGHVNLVK